MSTASLLAESIRQVRLHEVVPLKRLFDRALESDFSYFSAAYLQRVRWQNSLPHLSAAIVRSNRLVLGLWVDQILAGYVIARLRAADRAYIYWLYVQPDCRGRGLGKLLLSSALKSFSAEQVSRVELITHNRKDFYLANGFNVDQFAPAFIEDVDVYLMSRELS